MIVENLSRIRHAIGDRSCELVAVSKQQPDALIDEALASGLRVFGENRVQEAYTHWEKRRLLFPDLKLHLIGPLQSNKAEDAVALFDMIHSVDRPKIALALGEAMRKRGKSLPCFIQINTGNEPQKSGIGFDALADFLHFCRTEAKIEIIGLMCIPPVDDDPAIHFAAMQQAAKNHALPCLSMGMSNDYETAMQYGATHLRIGSALFARRMKG